MKFAFDVSLKFVMRGFSCEFQKHKKKHGYTLSFPSKKLTLRIIIPFRFYNLITLLRVKNWWEKLC